MNKIKSDKNLFEPVYWQSEPNESLEVGKYLGTIEYKDNTENTEFLVEQTFANKPHMIFKTKLKKISILSNDIQAKNIKINFSNFKPSIDAFVTRFKNSTSNDYVEIEITSKSIPIHLQSEKIILDDNVIKTSTFHLINFPISSVIGSNDYVFTANVDDTYSERIMSRIICEYDQWQIEIIEVKETKKIKEKLKDEGGMAITHIGRVSKKDGSCYSYNDLMKIDNVLFHMFSFCFCRWLSPAYWVSFDQFGKQVHKSFGIGFQSNDFGIKGNCIFDSTYGEMLENMFPLLCKMFESKDFKEFFHSIIYWYVLASETNIDAGIILSQAAMELFSSVYCVEIKKMVSQNAFTTGKLNAADKFRLLLSSLDVPFDFLFPDFNLTKPSNSNMIDVLDYIVYARNNLIHSNKKNNTVVNIDIYKSSQIYQWLIEVSLLKYIGYTLKYSNRLKRKWVGQVEDLPSRNT